jgi:hypothetical protein
MNCITKVLTLLESLNGFLPLIIALLAGNIALKQVRLNAIINAKIRRLEKLENTISDYVAELAGGIGNLKNFRSFKIKGEGVLDHPKDYYNIYTNNSRTINKLSSLTLLLLAGIEEENNLKDHLDEANTLFNVFDFSDQALNKLDDLNNVILMESQRIIGSESSKFGGRIRLFRKWRKK